MSLELRDQLRKRYGSQRVGDLITELVTPVQGVSADSEPPSEDLERAVAFQVESGRTVITAPAREVAMNNDGFMYLRGRFVEADTPNSNGALWTTGDLQLGERTVAGGPLNWLHNDHKIIGTLLEGRLVSGREAASQGVGSHIASTAAVWRFLFPQESRVIQQASANRELFYSMECVSREVACIGPQGCGGQFSYADYSAKRTCEHLKTPGNLRRFVDPAFLGGAVIVPPVRPGWAKAEVDIVRQAAKLQEAQPLGQDSLGREAAEQMTQQILMWANRSD